MCSKGSKAYSIFYLKCPRCHEGGTFETGSWSFVKPVDMLQRCPKCDLNYWPEPGYYYGAMFISYIWTAWFCLLFVALFNWGLGFSQTVAFGLLIAAFLLFRPLVERGGPSTPDREHARRLVREYGWDTLAYFSLRSDKSYFFASDGEAMIAYAYTNGYALVAGDPIGRPESLPVVLDEFLDFCRDRAWRAAFLSVREADVPRYKARGFNSVYLGDEAIIRCDTFSLHGGAMKPVRSAVNRVDKHHRFRLMREADASPALVHDLNEISREWRGKAAERGFTMELGREVEGANPDFLLAVAQTIEGHLDRRQHGLLIVMQDQG